jgi:hypothetical protein
MKYILWIVISVLILIIVVLIRISPRKISNCDTHESDSLRVILSRNAMVQKRAEAQKDSMRSLIVIKDSLIKYYEKKKKNYRRDEINHGNIIDRMDAGQLIEYSAGTSVGQPDYIYRRDSNSNDSVR